MRFLIRQLLFGILLFVSANATQAQPLLPGLEGQPLLDALVEEYKPIIVLDYSHARDTMYGRIYNQNDSVKCVYSGHTLYLQPGEDPSTWLFQNGDNDGINCEHTWPQSKGASTGNPESNMHHLFPSRSAVNTARGNLPFGEVPDPQTTHWYYLDQVRPDLPTANIERYSERKGSFFEPREDHKGNVARAMFYFNTMYYAESQAADPVFFATQQQDLCAWHFLDPADSLEIARTWLIASYQDGLPNPYVLDCTLAVRTFCPDTPGECPEPVSAVSEQATSNHQPLRIVPNPAEEGFTLDATLPGFITLADMLGQPLRRFEWATGQTIPCADLTQGVYFVVLQSVEGNSIGRLVKL